MEKNRNQLADVEENQKKLLDLLIAGTVPAEVYRCKNAEYETAKIELQAKIEQLQTPDNSVERAIDKVLNFSQNSFAIFKSSQIEEKRRILNIVFANFLMDGKNPEISMHKNFKLLSKIGACEDWCPEEDSNFHDQNGHKYLKLARLPIPPSGHIQLRYEQSYNVIFARCQYIRTNLITKLCLK